MLIKAILGVIHPLIESITGDEDEDEKLLALVANSLCTLLLLGQAAQVREIL